jgi:tetratricopeptide (TPR) repeat protein
MSRSAILSFLLLTSLSMISAPTVLAADPTLHQVYQAADAGNLSQAQSMLDKVLRDHPNSAKAHFVEAEILAKQGRRSDAASELNTAQRLAPGLPFANAQAVQSLKARLAPAALTDLGPPASTALGGNALRTLPAPWGMLMLGFGVFAYWDDAIRRHPPAPAPGTDSRRHPTAPVGRARRHPLPEEWARAFWAALPAAPPLVLAWLPAKRSCIA